MSKYPVVQFLLRKSGWLNERICTSIHHYVTNIDQKPKHTSQPERERERERERGWGGGGGGGDAGRNVRQ